MVSFVVDTLACLVCGVPMYCISRLYYVVRYRRKIVRKNLEGSFPEKTPEEIVRIEKKFYRFFCDCVVENLKLFSMSQKQVMRRMTFSGADDMVADLAATGKNFCFIYLGHYCNWEWIASLAYWYPIPSIAGRFTILCIIGHSINCFFTFATVLAENVSR